MEIVGVLCIFAASEIDLLFSSIFKSKLDVIYVFLVNILKDVQNNKSSDNLQLLMNLKFFLNFSKCYLLSLLLLTEISKQNIKFTGDWSCNLHLKRNLKWDI